MGQRCQEKQEGALDLQIQRPCGCAFWCVVLELELIQPHMAQKPVLRGEVGCACVVREVSIERERSYGRAVCNISSSLCI